eukprot:TRINITY_DN25684_c0_g1_i1.p1 TRINITY_DN25684_c0_g1~~TRINITY_DN25684_c0_g1_i1.p1  ORF type:complete len:587 (-),score=138.58 TRINITY_DN25684_c0_g1_i1:132-1892(-)
MPRAVNIVFLLFSVLISSPRAVHAPVDTFKGPPREPGTEEARSQAEVVPSFEEVPSVVGTTAGTSADVSDAAVGDTSTSVDLAERLTAEAADEVSAAERAAAHEEDELMHGAAVFEVNAVKNLVKSLDAHEETRRQRVNAAVSDALHRAQSADSIVEVTRAASAALMKMESAENEDDLIELDIKKLKGLLHLEGVSERSVDGMPETGNDVEKNKYTVKSAEATEAQALRLMAGAKKASGAKTQAVSAALATSANHEVASASKQLEKPMSPEETLVAEKLFKSVLATAGFKEGINKDTNISVAPSKHDHARNSLQAFGKAARRRAEARKNVLDGVPAVGSTRSSAALHQTNGLRKRESREKIDKTKGHSTDRANEAVMKARTATEEGVILQEDLRRLLTAVEQSENVSLESQLTHYLQQKAGNLVAEAQNEKHMAKRKLKASSDPNEKSAEIEKVALAEQAALKASEQASSIGRSVVRIDHAMRVSKRNTRKAEDVVHEDEKRLLDTVKSLSVADTMAAGLAQESTQGADSSKVLNRAKTIEKKAQLAVGHLKPDEPENISVPTRVLRNLALRIVETIRNETEKPVT